MSAKLFNPIAKKFVDVDPKQIPVLLKAGWLSPNDEKIKAIQKESEGSTKEESQAGEAKQAKKTVKEKIAESKKAK